MKLISFFSRFTFICNICFLIFILINRLEAKKPVAATPGAVLPLPFFKDLVIILGFSAIVINFLMCIVYAVVLIAKKTLPLPKWLPPVNFIFLLIQFYFFFL
jgi:hypothetical protein